ncbi:cysteine protease StiP family protein [Aneurinibacillus sp. Ricciae_BoGa-3]|nr:cysteine protease StiP family protein [Aneurinibacillus sp. Ricciae_BoGa-3]WCK56745.1 cysteine protease StiP family protein [Aneurinibacillus sp. Ricciae_BoGa-3]
MTNHPVLPHPQPIGSYAPDDAIFVLKNIGESLNESSTEERERAVQSGAHYSEMLPQEYKPTDEYMKIFYTSLAQTAHKLAETAAVAAERIIQQRGTNLVLVSLARAGTPIGILFKRYIHLRFGISLPHYSVSIIRGKGIDENAILYILQQHPDRQIQFVDGWTGKGAITKELREACSLFQTNHGINLSAQLAVAADPGHCTELYGTREDFLIPSACLNATVSGLISRTVHRSDIIGHNDYHGAKFYTELQKEDVSGFFVETIARLFPYTIEKAIIQANNYPLDLASWKGMDDVARIGRQFAIPDVNLIKPGVGETTRVLLRRIPWKILIHPERVHNLTHVLQLAHERQVPLETYPDMSFSCCGLIKCIGGGET